MELDFATVVAINAGVQQVAEATRRLYLVSLNAMFTAKQNGGRAGAFARVTAELRSFAERMQRQMELLREYIFKLVEQVSEQRRQRRCFTLMERAEALAREEGYAGPVLTGRGRVRAMAESLAATCILFGRALKETRRLLVAGETLVVMAKVEAAAARTGAEPLLRVAEELHQVVAGIGDLLTRLGKGEQGMRERLA